MLSFLYKYKKNRQLNLDINSTRPWELRHLDRVDELFKLDASVSFDIIYDNKIIGNTLSLKSLKNKEVGDCFIVGTGPSLDEIDFSLLKNKNCIGVNGSIIKFTEFNIVPKYYVITTQDFFENKIDLVRDVVNSGTSCFFPYWGISSICNKIKNEIINSKIYLTDPINQRYNTPRLKSKKFYNYVNNDKDFLLHSKCKRTSDKVGFSKNLCKGYFHGENVVYTALQHGYYLGYRRFYILGMDLSYVGNKVRFYEKKDNARPNWLDLSYERSIVPCFEIVKEMIDSNILEVYNVSAKSRLPECLLRKMSFEEAISLSTV